MCASPYYICMYTTKFFSLPHKQPFANGRPTHCLHDVRTGTLISANLLDFHRLNRGTKCHAILLIQWFTCTVSVLSNFHKHFIFFCTSLKNPPGDVLFRVRRKCFLPPASFWTKWIRRGRVDFVKKSAGGRLLDRRLYFATSAQSPETRSLCRRTRRLFPKAAFTPAQHVALL